MMSQAPRQERILAVDDELPVLKLFQSILTRKDYKVFSASSVHEAIKILETTDIDLVITDQRMPKQSGLDLIRHVKENYKYTEVLMVTGYPSIEGAISAVKTGAEEYLAKPFTPRELIAAAERALEKQRSRKMGAAEAHVAAAAALGMIGSSEIMRGVFHSIVKAAQASATVLISGESGTGKELVARAIHYESPRQSAPFTAVNCGGIPEEFLDRELFGYARITPSPDSRANMGLFQISDGGTIFLDGIDNLSLTLQTKLLRVIDDREIVGQDDQRTLKVDIRIIASTTKALQALVGSGAFREDLYHRINVISIALPQLNERGDDIMLLARHFAAKFARELGKPIPGFTAKAAEIIRNYAFPGNVRGLENIIQSLVVMLDSDTIDITDLPTCMRFSATGAGGRPKTLEEMESEYLRFILASEGGNKSRAAEILGIDRKTLRMKMKKIEEADK